MCIKCSYMSYSEDSINKFLVSWRDSNTAKLLHPELFSFWFSCVQSPHTCNIVISALIIYCIFIFSATWWSITFFAKLTNFSAFQFLKFLHIIRLIFVIVSYKQNIVYKKLLLSVLFQLSHLQMNIRGLIHPTNFNDHTIWSDNSGSAQQNKC